MSNIDPNLVLFHLDGPGDKQPDLLAAAVSTIVLAVAAVVLRFYARYTSRANFWWDDWLMLPALAVAFALEGVLFWWYSYGLGKYTGAVTMGRLRVAFVTIFVGELLYSAVLGIVKFSVLALMYRIFRHKWARIYVWILAGINGLWLLASIIVTCMECQPTRAFWNRLMPGAHCMADFRTPYIGTAAVTIITDVAIIILPICMVAHLHLSKINKVLLCGVFASGLFVTVISGVRLNALVHFDSDESAAFNIYWNFSDTALWSLVEANMAIVSGCLPCLRPLLRRILPEKVKNLPQYLRRSEKGGAYRYAGLSGTTKAESELESSGCFSKVKALRRSSIFSLGKKEEVFSVEPTSLSTVDHKPQQRVKHNTLATAASNRRGATNTMVSISESDEQLPLQDLEGNNIRPAKLRAPTFEIWRGHQHDTRRSGRTSTETHITSGQTHTAAGIGIRVDSTWDVEQSRYSQVSTT